MTDRPSFPPKLGSHFFQNVDLTPKQIDNIAKKVNLIMRSPYRDLFVRVAQQYLIHHLANAQVINTRPFSEKVHTVYTFPVYEERAPPPSSTKEPPSYIQEEVIEVLPTMEELPVIDIEEGISSRPGASATEESAVERQFLSAQTAGQRPSKTDQELRAERREMLAQLSNGFTKGDFLFIIRLTKFSQSAEELKQGARPSKEAKSSSATAAQAGAFLPTMEEFVGNLERLNQDVYYLRGQLESLLGQVGKGIEEKMKQILLIHQEIGQLLLEAKESHAKQGTATVSQLAQLEMLKAKLEQLRTEVRGFLSKFDQALSPDKMLTSPGFQKSDQMDAQKQSLAPEMGKMAATVKQTSTEVSPLMEQAQAKEVMEQAKEALQAKSAAALFTATSAEAASASQTTTPLPLPIPVRTAADFMKSLHLVQMNLQNKTMQLPITFIVPYPAPTKIETAVSKGTGKEKDVKEEEEGEMEGEGGAQERALLFSYIPEGITLVGDFFNEGKEDELPLRQVYLKAFLISATPITNLQYSRWLNTKLAAQQVHLTQKGEVMDKHGMILLRTIQKDPLSQIQIQTIKGKLRFIPIVGKEYHPVVSVTYFGAEAFCLDNGFRLPNEAEWEKAASMEPEEEGKPLKKLRYGCGSNEVSLALANYTEGFSTQRKKENLSFPVGFYNGNTVFIRAGKRIKTENGKTPYGCFDMCGNVRQWVDEWASKEQLEKIAKGGAYDSSPFEIRASARVYLEPSSADPITGFRVVLDIP